MPERRIRFDPDPPHGWRSRARITDVLYDRLRGQMSIGLETKDCRILLTLDLAVFTFNGKPHGQLARDEVDKEMWRRAKALWEARGAFMQVPVVGKGQEEP